MSHPSLQIEQLASLKHSHEYVVQQVDVDVMGHLNISSYVGICYQGIRNFSSYLGITEQYIREQKKGTFVLKSFDQYILETLLNDHVSVRSRLLGYTQKRYHSIHFIVNETQRVLSATFEIIVGHVDLELRKSCNFQEDTIIRMDALLTEHQKLDLDTFTCGFLFP